MPKQTIERRKEGKKFAYYRNGSKLADKKQLQRLDALRVPPAWQNVQISVNQNAKVQATGYDKAGRLQYIYHPSFRARQEQAKFDRIMKFAKALPKMRRQTEADLRLPGLNKDKILALVVRLMDEAYFRVGNEQYAKDNQHYGLATLRSKHISIDGDTVNFDFVGKSGQRQIKKLTDRRIARLMKRLDELPGYEVFKYYDDDGNLAKVKSTEVNAYIKAVMGEEFSAKDFRTWGGTLLAAAELAEAERAQSERERKKAVTLCVKKVARKLGNTPAIARASYIDPRIINSFLDSDDLRRIRRTMRSVNNDYLRREERCVLKLLEKAT